MRLLSKLALIGALVALTLISCRKDEESFGSLPPIPTTPERFVNGSVSGIVTDENNIAVVDADVTLGTTSRSTDENGYFSFQNVDINTKGSLVTIDKEGYFHGATFVKSTLNSQNFTRVELIEKVQTGSFSASTGGTITSSDGVSIVFDGNAIIREDGVPYTDLVNVYTTWLDPMSLDLSLRMPGDLRAFNEAGMQQQLTTFGMIGVELESADGESLNIADDKTATITVPLSTELVGSAPTTIPLWHYDETSGYWLEEGEARLEGNSYVGAVSHFSFWNCDVPNDFINLEGTVIEADGDPLQNVIVRITEIGTGLSACDITDKGGEFSGAVPRDVELVITIIDNCGVEIYTATIGPFTEDTVLPTITANSNNASLTISGSLVNCDNNPVTNGYIKIDIGSDAYEILPTDENGEVSGTINTCGADSITITAYDQDNLTQSASANYEVSDLFRLNLATTFVCDDLEEYFLFTIGGVQALDPEPFGIAGTINEEQEEGIFISGVDPRPDVSTRISLYVVTTAIGTYTPFLSSASFVNPNPTPRNTGLRCEDDCDITVELTTLEGIGGFAIGSFSGMMEQTGIDEQEFEVTGTFKQ